MDGHSRVTDIYTVEEIRRRGTPLAGACVPAGFPSPADDYVEQRLDLNQHLIPHPAATFFVRVAGESMTGASIHHKDLLIVDRSLEAVPGNVVVAALDGEMVVKRLNRVKNRLVLMPENDEFPFVEIKRGCDFTIWGVVTYVIHPL